MKNIISKLFALFFLITFSIHSNGIADNYELLNIKTDVNLHTSNLIDSDSFATSTCSADIGNVNIEVTVNCFLCSQAAADRKCQRKLNQVLTRVDVNENCECIY